jgi:hypothetical protein
VVKIENLVWQVLFQYGLLFGGVGEEILAPILNYQAFQEDSSFYVMPNHSVGLKVY